MIRILFGIFFMLHGLVHLLYFGQSARVFELQPGMVWPDGSWAFSRLVLAAIGFVASGAGILAKQPWWRPAITATAAFSTVIFVLFWAGGLQHFDNKGGIGGLINLAILAIVLMAQWPKLDF
jgi:hypothetical protein